MPYKQFLAFASAALTIVLMSLILTTGATAQHYQTLYKFTGGSDGSQPMDGPILDSAGNLYGSTYFGGAGGYGTVFELTPTPGGGWTESVLYSFHGEDGWRPNSAVTFDAAGNLYGTTFWGNSINGDGAGWGLVFKLTPNLDGSWSESVLYGFTGYADGGNPVGRLILDASGNIYGTTLAGGTTTCYAGSGCGTVFKLTPNPDGSWSKSILYSFKGGDDGEYLYYGLVFDTAGNIYGTTAAGGKGSCAWNYGPGCGTVFELTPNADGTWTEHVLHRFTGGMDGGSPQSNLIIDNSGNLYGTTYQNGAHGYGNVFELIPNGNGSWKEKVLHQFANTDGANALAGVTFDAAGNLYGATYAGGDLSYCNGAGCGVVYKLVPNAEGSWAEKMLHSFTGHLPSNPIGELTMDSVGNLYGATMYCGGACVGAEFEITP